MTNIREQIFKSINWKPITVCCTSAKTPKVGHILEGHKVCDEHLLNVQIFTYKK